MPAFKEQVWPPFPAQIDAVAKGVWYPLWLELGHNSASGTEGEVISTQTLRIEGVRRVVSQRKTKVFLPEGETGAEQRKKTTTVCIKQAAAYYACHKQSKSHLIAFQTISPFCCHSHPFPHPTRIDRAPVQP